ncbi:MAG: 50S ribosomal protein L7/L12 [Clostridia bacterium]|nr:50S ribosomal protein L7/L12 [Clostridia bacterium]
MAKINDLIEQIKGLTVVEVSELVKALEEEFGVSAAAPVAVAAPAAAGAPAAAQEAASEAKAAYNVVLKGVKADGNKIAVIKAVKELSGLGLSESKALVEGAPKTVKENVPTEEAKSMQKKLEEAGAEIELA